MHTFRGVVTAAVVSAGTLIGLSPPAAALPPLATYLHSSVEQVQFSSGKSLFFDIVVSQSSTSTPHTKVFFTVATRNPSGKGLDEQHGWNIPVTDSAFTADGSGNATLATGSQLSPFGSLHLTFTPAGGGQSTCNGSITEYTGALAGKVHLGTNTTTWGKFASDTFTFTGPNTLDVYNSACSVPFTPGPCLDGLQWRALAFNGNTYTVSPGAIFANRLINLKSPSGAVREDHLGAASPTPTLSSGTVSITTSGSRFDGRATITGASRDGSSSFGCDANGTPKTEKEITFDSGDWKSPKAHRLQANLQITGSIRAPVSSTGQALFYKYSFS